MNDDDIHHFLKYGYVCMKQAFSKETANACRNLLWERMKDEGIQRSDPSTWIKKLPLGEVYGLDSQPPWKDVFTSVLSSSMSRICGEDKLMDFGCGWWMITFPGHANGEWKVDGSWHIDGQYRHYPFNKEIGVSFLFISRTSIYIKSHTTYLLFIYRFYP